MESKLATEARQRLLVASQKLTPAQRLEAFLVHNRLVVDLYRAGQRVRASGRQSQAHEG